MAYYVDESGYWLNPQKGGSCLLIGSFYSSDNIELELELGYALRDVMAKAGLETLHAAELQPEVRLRCLELIHDYLDDDDAILVHVFPPSILEGSSLMQIDDIYIDKAGQLLGTLALGDTQVDIRHDLRFYYAYPENVINNINELPYAIDFAA